MSGEGRSHAVVVLRSVVDLEMFHGFFQRQRYVDACPLCSQLRSVGLGLDATAATRVLLMVSSNNPAFVQSWSSTDDVIPVALNGLKDHQLLRLPEIADIPWKTLVKRNDGLRTFIVFDIFHTDYDCATAHLPEHNDLPVLVVHLSRRGLHARTAESGLRRRVNRETAEAHNLNGWDAAPPYTVDLTTMVPIYMNPRDISAPHPKANVDAQPEESLVGGGRPE